MKKLKLKIAMVAVVAAVAGYVTYQNQAKEVMSELALANVEALARGEGGGECSGCIQNSLYFCKFFGWGGCFGDPMWHYV